MIQTINLSDDFASRLVDLILDQTRTPFDIAQTTIILPTRRACQNIKNTFIKKSNGQSLLLPKLIPLYDLDDLDQNLLPTIDSWHRLFLLTHLCAQKPNAGGMDQSLKMAISLTEILDELYQFEIDFNKIKDLVPEQKFAEHWNQTATFLDIITDAWPKILAELNLMDKSDKNIQLINHYANKWHKNPPTHPIIMAGFNGTIPAVCKLIKTIHASHNGLVLLHGFDASMNDDTYANLDANHFQFPFKKLLDFLNLKPSDVTAISPTPLAKEIFISESLKPESQTDTWRTLKPFSTDTLQSVRRIDCQTAGDESLTIALALRAVLETPEKTASLVTNDRTLARRVIVEMRRWGIELNDSAGTPLPKTQIGTFLSLIANLGIDTTQNTLLSLLKHPLTADHKEPSHLRLMVKEFEKIARQKHTPLDISLTTSLTNFTQLFQTNTRKPLTEMLQKHIVLAEQLATTPTQLGSIRLWNNDDGTAAFDLLTTLQTHADLLGDIEPATYPTLFEILMTRVQVRPRYGLHPRLSVLGPIESRLFHSDVCIIGGMNEGVFPQLPDTGPWLNRTMRAQLGLPSLEIKISDAAHDFAHNFCTPETYLTRSLKTDGSPTIPSRFLSRMEAVAEATSLPFPTYPATLAIHVQTPTIFENTARPQPCPPLDVRPRQLSVTEIEKWMSDPYSIYAKHILKLRKLDDFDEDKKHANLGSAIHDAIDIFTTETPFSTDKKHLVSLFNDKLKQYPFSPSDIIFYQQKLDYLADWFINEQISRQHLVRQILPEITGKTTLTPANHKPFTLTCRADRVDLMNDSTIQLIDYKTGTVPKSTMVNAGYASQLPLEGYIIAQSGFAEISPHPVSKMEYWKLSVNKDASEITNAAGKTSPTELIDAAKEKLLQLIDTFDDATTPYASCPIPEHIPKYNDYEHLARIKEWMHEKEEGDTE